MMYAIIVVIGLIALAASVIVTALVIRRTNERRSDDWEEFRAALIASDEVTITQAVLRSGTYRFRLRKLDHDVDCEAGFEPRIRELTLTADGLVMKDRVADLSDPAQATRLLRHTSGLRDDATSQNVARGATAAPQAGH